MKRRIALSVVAAFLLAAAISPASRSASTRGGHSQHARQGALQALRALGSEEGPAGPASDWWYAQRAGKGRISTRVYERALAQARALRAGTAQDDPALAQASWEAMGPLNVGGRVTDLAVTHTGVYAATASGGVQKSGDGGVTWTHSWPSDITQAMGALAAGSDDVLYAGTGEANPGGGSIVYGGTGLYRSKDGGTTWQRVGLETSGAFGRIAVDPKNPKRVFAAAAGNLFVPGGERGVYRSTDGGDTWTRVLAGDNLTTGGVDVAIDPVNPNNVLAAMWDHQRLPTHRVYGGVGSGVYLSNDGGDTWTRVTIPTGLAPKDIGRIGVAFAPSNPSRAYAVVANKLNGNGVGLYRSNDGGRTWASTGVAASSLSQSTYGWWFGRVWVDPADANRLFVAGLELIESTDGGASFTAQSASTGGVATGASIVLVHADQHAMLWDPYMANRVFLGNDGGTYHSETNGHTWIGGVSQGWTQQYTVDVSEQNPSRVVAGLQDNMCQRNYVGGNVGHPMTWTKYGLCGDGLQTLIDPADDNVVYGCAQYGGNCSRTVDGGGAFLFLGTVESDRFGWLAPIVFDPNNSKVLYSGGNILNRSDDQGDTWTAISPDLSTKPQQLDPNAGYRIYGTITTVAVAKTDSKVIYVGTDDGLLWRTADGGTTWTKLTDHDTVNDLPGTWVTRVTVDPADANVVYATYSGFRGGNNEAHVVRSADGGNTWTNISGNLPAAPVSDLLVVGSRLIVATDVGVFLSADGGQTWLAVGTGMPTTPVLDLEYNAGTNSITAATFGFGIQRAALP